MEGKSEIASVLPDQTSGLKHTTPKRVETKMRGINSFGERIAARDPDRQTAEIHILVALTNGLKALGTAEIILVA